MTAQPPPATPGVGDEVRFIPDAGWGGHVDGEVVATVRGILQVQVGQTLYAVPASAVRVLQRCGS